ncbi:MAG: TrkH family potassium uptake protein, partial [Bacteroidales bacterium]|nr:TrkH family potassium uptake protein [Bacteroidales bacterium]
YLWILIVSSVVVAVSLRANGIETSWGKSFLNSAFHVLSYASTTGFGISDNAVWPALPSAMLVFVSIWCGMAGSTTGGIKSDRALLLCKEIHYRLKTVLHPASVNEVRVNRRVVRQEDISPHILYIALYMMLIILSLAINLAVNPHNANAVAATFTSLSNVGPALGDLGVMGNFSAEPTGAKMMYTIDMFLGRVEIYPLLAVLMMLFGKSAK